jgi:hypothetical protein
MMVGCWLLTAYLQKLLGALPHDACADCARARGNPDIVLSAPMPDARFQDQTPTI